MHLRYEILNDSLGCLTLAPLRRISRACCGCPISQERTQPSWSTTQLPRPIYPPRKRQLRLAERVPEAVISNSPQRVHRRRPVPVPACLEGELSLPLVDDSHAPVAEKHRRFSPEDMQVMRAEVDKLLDRGILRPSESPWSAQVLCDIIMDATMRCVWTGVGVQQPLSVKQWVLERHANHFRVSEASGPSHSWS